MKRQSIAFLVMLGLVAIPATSLVSPRVSAFLAQREERLAPQALEALARDITVKVLVGETAASGTLIAKEALYNDRIIYYVLTNRHVMKAGDDYRIRTPDGDIHEAESRGYDIRHDVGLLSFISSGEYATGKVGDWETLPEEGDRIWVAGFPFGTDQLQIEKGKIGMIPDRLLKDGYRLGYTNPIQQGMSGGVILNAVGEVIGINGMSANPILLDAYEFLDGQKPDAETIETMQQLSWGVPFSAVQEAGPEFVAYFFPQGEAVPAGMVSGESTALTGVAGEVNEVAQGITVRIEGEAGNGSGVIVAKQGRTYYVLTAAHVVQGRDRKSIAEGLKLLAPDGDKHLLKKSEIVVSEGLDVAVVKFQSGLKNYPVATLGNYKIDAEERFYSFVSGFPGKKRMLSAGVFFSDERSIVAAQSVDTKTASMEALRGGYELVYTNVTQSGMSGGAVLDRLGRLIGIHGQSEGDSLQNVQFGYSLGIPVASVLGFLEQEAQVKREWLKIETEKPSFVATDDSQTIQEIFYTVKNAPTSKNARDWLNYGNQLWRIGKQKEAVQAFEEALRINNRLPLAWYGRGVALSDLREYNEAARSFQKATQLKPNFPEAWREWGEVLQNAQQYESALVAYEQAIALKPDNFSLYYSKGWILSMMLKRYSDAEVAYSRAIEIRPHPFAYIARGLVYYDLKEYDKAIADHTQAIALNPNYTDAYVGRGLVYDDLKEYDKAIADFKQAIALNPNYAQAYNNRGLVYDNLKEYDQALADYNQAIALNPNYAQAYNSRGAVYYDHKEYDLALADYTESIDLKNPELHLPYNNRGIVYSDLKEYDLALADYNQAIALNPNFADAYIGRGNVYYNQGKYQKALADYNRAIEINPDYTLALNNRKVVYEKLGDQN